MTKRIGWLLLVGLFIFSIVIGYQNVVIKAQQETIRGFLDACTYSAAPQVQIREQ